MEPGACHDKNKKIRFISPARAGPGITAELGGCVVPDNAYLMELNRNGKWREAERIGQDAKIFKFILWISNGKVGIGLLLYL